MSPYGLQAVKGHTCAEARWRGMPLDVRRQQVKSGGEVLGVPAIVEGSDHLHVLLRHRPPSIPLGEGRCQRRGAEGPASGSLLRALCLTREVEVRSPRGRSNGASALSEGASQRLTPREPCVIASRG